MRDNDNKPDPDTINRRRLLLAALAGGAGAALPACAPRSEPDLADGDDLWAGFDDRITERTLAEAEKLFGLSFSEAERRQILGGPIEESEDGYFAGQIDSLRRRREFNLPNTLQPALAFDPRLPGIDYGMQDDAVALAVSDFGELPTSAEDVAFAPAAAQAHWMSTGQISSRELTEIYLERIDRYGPLLQCFITVTPELARAEADRADRERAAGTVRGPLHGIPYGVKDLMDTKGIATTWGAMPFKDRVPGSDSAVVTRLREAGAVLLGKTAVGALAWGDVWFDGEARNPWNPKEGASGSSAGSGSATAAGLCSFAIGTETLGSIVSPSDRNGVTGLRPSFGRVSRVGTMALCWSLDKAGPMCRFVEDTALVLAALNGYDARDTGSIDMGFEYDGKATLDGLTIGYEPAWFEGDGVLDAHRAALDAAGRLGAKLEAITVPEVPTEEILPALGIESAAAFESLTLSGDDELLRRQVDNAWPNSFRESRYFSAVDYVQADRLRRLVMREMHAFLGEVDVVLGPSFGNPMLVATNFTGQPSLTLRAGYDEITPRPLFSRPENDADTTTARVPRSVTLWAPLFEERRLIAVGRALEAELGVAAGRPPLG